MNFEKGLVKRDAVAKGPRWLVLRAWLPLVLVAFFASGLFAKQSERPTSLDIVPDSVSFYMASMNHAAQYNAFVNSNAYKQLMDTDVAKRMRKAYRTGRRKGFSQFGYGNPFGQYLEGYAQTIGTVPGKMAMNYLSSIFGNEVFIYADEDWLEMSRGISKFYQHASETMVDVDLQNMDPETIKALLALGREHLGNVNTPTIVMGTVLDSPGETKSLLQMAELGIDQVMAQIPDEMEYVFEGYEVIEEDGMYLLSIQLNSDSMPWDEIKSDSDFEPFYEDIRAILDNKSINITMGVKDKFLLFSVGPNNDHIRNLGDGGLLIDHEKLAPLKTAYANHPVTSVRFTSEESAKFNHESIPGTIDSVISVVSVLIDTLSEDEKAILDGLVGDLKEDGEELKKDLMTHLPKPGAYLGFSYMFENGYEGFKYNWAENKSFDSSKPLDLLRFAGKRPTLLAVGREADQQVQFDVVRKWMGRLFDHVTKYGGRAMPDRDARIFYEFMPELRSILGDVADSTDDNLLAATKGSQSMMVLDFTSAKDAWHDEMPVADEDLPIPSIAVVIEHQDKEKMEAAGSSYFGAVVDFTEVIRRMPGNGMPDEFRIPEPKRKSAMDGDLYYYPFPMEAGLDSSIAPHVLVRDDVVVLGYSLDQTERLLNAGNAEFGGLLSDRSRKMMGASYYNNHELIDALYAWANYGIELAKEDGAVLDLPVAENDLLSFKEAELREAADHVIALIRCFESSSSISYMEDGAQVTRYQMLFQDVSGK